MYNALRIIQTSIFYTSSMYVLIKPNNIIINSKIQFCCDNLSYC